MRVPSFSGLEVTLTRGSDLRTHLAVADGDKDVLVRTPPAGFASNAVVYLVDGDWAAFADQIFNKGASSHDLTLARVVDEQFPAATALMRRTGTNMMSCV